MTSSRQRGPQVETLIDRFLDEQANPSAAERFARDHDAEQLPAAARHYQALMPATPPGPGQQYGFDVDLDACTGCKACVTACRSLNGLDADETWRSVGLLVGEADGQALQQHVTTACHHCVEPGCLAGCPVDAYDKDPDTGIVVHLEDQCIGCGYCTLTCPYEVPRFDRERGVVRKCDLCADRLADGEAPACVQACPTHAISVRVVDTGQALTVMLVLTQLAVGTYLVDLVAGVHGVVGALVALATAVVALGASVGHLGRPRYAYRAVIGLGHSWLSREIVAFGAFAGLAALDAGARLLATVAPDAGGVATTLADVALWLVAAPLSIAAALAGVAGVASSVMVYAVTGKHWWRVRPVGARFALTTLAGGLALVWAVTLTGAWAAGEPAGELARQLAVAPAAVVAVKLAVELSLLRHANGPASHELARTARLLTGALARATRWRVGLGVVGGVGLPLWVALLLTSGGGTVGAATLLAWVATGALTAGELIERWHFFTAVSARGMPGGVR
ncbi:MAG: molybdopterin oxidoreductase [Actinobacteria bacterium QS_8_72_14]|nr:MAG: molybdopterin oxidoreductase [Actinobacteria bacterium QS_8_72_14]